MKSHSVVLGLGVLAAGVGLAGCEGTQPPAASARSAPATTSHAAPLVTKTVIKVKTVQPTPKATAKAPDTASGTAAPQPVVKPNVTDPWAVVSAYYGDIDSRDYPQAYALIGNGSTTGQSYAEFVAGFSCTGAQAVSENWESGDQVNFDLAAVDSCTGNTQYFTGTDTVENGVIVAARVAAAG
jgi:hypothetical protein